MKRQLTYRDKEVLINDISRYYSVSDIRSLGRVLEINESDYFNSNVTIKVLTDSFITRVFQLSKQHMLLDIIQNDDNLKRENIIKDIFCDNFISDSNPKDSIRILHLSDIHLGTLEDAHKYELQLKTDLFCALDVEKLDFLIISGDITNEASSEEYNAAVILINSIVKKFGIDTNKIIIVPGNHDLSWDISKKAIIKDDGSEFDEETYMLRFDNFNKCFYKMICNKDYPTEYDKQGILHKYEEEKIIILELNSSWHIDHINKLRASIYMPSMSEPLDDIMSKKYDDWLKIAVFHHSVSEKDSMDNGFLQILVRNGFKICMHGHIHEAKYDFYPYGSNSNIAIIGAGTFGAPAKEHVLGVPFQYNFIELSSNNKTIKVNTRRREKIDGAWEADSRWGDKDNPKPFYEIDLSKNNMKY